MSKKTIGMIEMAICAVLWSLAGVLIKKISAGPMVIAGIRSLFAAACTLCYMMITKVKFVVNKRVFLGSIFTAATFLLFVSANKMTDAANAIVLQYTQPIFSLVFSWMFFKEKLLKKDIAVAFFTLFGVALFFADNLSGDKMLGNIVAIGAGASIALAFMIYGHVTQAERLAGMVLGHLLTALVGIGYFLLNPEKVTGTDVFYMGVLGIFQLGIAYVFFCLAVDKISSFACSIIGAIEPLLNPILVMIFVGETPGKYALFGSIVVIGAVTVWCMLDAKNDKNKEKTAVS